MYWHVVRLLGPTNRCVLVCVLVCAHECCVRVGQASAAPEHVGGCWQLRAGRMTG